MNIPKFTFRLPEPNIPPEVPEDFKEYMKRQQAMLFLPMHCDYSPIMSFDDFKRLWGKRRDNPNVSTMVVEEFTTIPTPRISPNPAREHWLKKFMDEYLKDNDNG